MIIIKITIGFVISVSLSYGEVAIFRTNAEFTQTHSLYNLD